MPTIRKLITFSPLAASLLERASGAGKHRAGGDYLSAVLEQRSRAWTDGLQVLRDRGWTHARIAEHCESMAGLSVGHARVPAWWQERGGEVQLWHALADVALEYLAGNQHLRGLLTTKEGSGAEL